MRNALFGAGVLFAAAAMPPAGTAPQCLWTGTQLICPPPPSAAAHQSGGYPAARSFPPSWSYGPWDNAAHSYKFGTQ